MKILYMNSGAIGILRDCKKGYNFTISQSNFKKLQNRLNYFFDVCIMERASKKWFTDCTLNAEFENLDNTGKDVFASVSNIYSILLGEEILAKNEIDFYEKKSIYLNSFYSDTIPF